MNIFRRIFSGFSNTSGVEKPPEIQLPLSLTARDYGETSPKTWDRLLAPGWVLEGHFTMWEVADFIRQERPKYPDAQLFAVLEDVNQAFYTSGHSLASNRLDDINPDTQTGLHPGSFEIFEEGEPAEFIGLTHTSEFPIRHQMFMDFAERSKSDCWQNGMMWYDEPHGFPTLLPGSHPHDIIGGEPWPRDTRGYVMRVPVDKPSEAISIFPNGYFSDDLGPDENYHLAKALEDRFGLSIIGLGATYAGYMRDEPFSEADAKALGAFLSPLYSNDPGDVADRIAIIATGEHTLFLAYANR